MRSYRNNCNPRKRRNKDWSTDTLLSRINKTDGFLKKQPESEWICWSFTCVVVVNKRIKMMWQFMLIREMVPYAHRACKQNRKSIKKTNSLGIVLCRNTCSRYYKKWCDVYSCTIYTWFTYLIEKKNTRENGLTCSSLYHKNIWNVLYFLS